MKTCPRCESEKPLEEFGRNRAHADGRAIYCKPCTREYAKAYHRRPDRAYTKQLGRYNITPERYEAMLIAQDYRCAICSVHVDVVTERDIIKAGRPGRLCVDHDHESGKVRALLCRRCNTALGNAYDNPDILRRAAAYLEYHRGQ